MRVHHPGFFGLPEAPCVLEPAPDVLNFATACIEVLHKAYAAGKAYPKSQVLEAEAAASCQAGGSLIMRELRRKFFITCPYLMLGFDDSEQ